MSLALVGTLTVAALAANTWTVDDDGPANFPSISAAVNAASDGDIILVAPGAYHGFATDKALSILGDPSGTMPAIIGSVLILGAARFTLAGIAMTGLVAQDIPGRFVLDESVVTGAGLPPAARLTNCAQALVSRVTITGPASGLGFMVEGTSATIVDSTIRGGNGPDFVHPPANGGIGMNVRAGSIVVLAGSSVFGGHAGFNDSSIQGFSGSALRVESGAKAIARGLATHLIAPGSASPFGTPGSAIEAPGTAKVIWSGVAVIGAIVEGSPGNVVHPTVAEPWQRIVGSDVPGGSRTIEVFGPTGADTILFAALQPGTIVHPALELPLWFAPASTLAVLSFDTLGVATPVQIPVAIPASPSFVGIEFEVQPVFPTLGSTLAPGKAIVGNAASIVLRK